MCCQEVGEKQTVRLHRGISFHFFLLRLSKFEFVLLFPVLFGSFAFHFCFSVVFFPPLSQLTCAVSADHPLCISVPSSLLCPFAIIVRSRSFVSFSRCVFVVVVSALHFAFIRYFAVFDLCFSFSCLSCYVLCLLLASFVTLQIKFAFC